MSNRTRSTRRIASAGVALLAGVLLLAACASDVQPGAGGAATPGGSSTADDPVPSAPDLGTQSSESPGSVSSPSGSTGSPDTAEGATPAPAGLADYKFTSKSATGRKLVKDKPLTIAFGDPGKVALHAGCNGMGGTPVFDGAELKVDRIVSTMMACVDPAGGNSVMDQENWYGSWLTAGVSWKLDGTELVLSGDDVSVTFERTGKADATTSSAATASTAPAVPTAASSAVAPTSVAASHPSVPAAHTAITAPTAGAVTPIPVTPPARPEPGGNSLPVQPPATESASLGFLTGKTYKLVRTWTDAGGENRMRKGVDFRITFGDNVAQTAGDCGTLRYSSVLLTMKGSGKGEVSMGAPTGPNCTIGGDPAGPPSGDLLASWKGKELTLSTGFTMWIFEGI